MTEEILSVKLNEFDRLFTRMHDLIQTSNSFSRERLREEIRALSEEYAKNELHLRNSLRQSKAAASDTLLDGYNMVEDALDFIMLAASRGLIFSLETMAEERSILAQESR